MTAAELDALAALANAATPGPWVRNIVLPNYYIAYCEREPGLSIAVYGNDRGITPPECSEDVVRDAAAFIAAAREAVPKLIARVRELEAEVAASCAWCGNSTKTRDE